ncbi:hypothetical protein, conserved [Lachnospiraceae bacterium KM106-2]|nr:hypothetical protein, conserved [Lachnospiraceae bacterium KM106-2]
MRIIFIKIAYEEEKLVYEFRIFGYQFLGTNKKKRKPRRKKRKKVKKKSRSKSKERQDAKKAIPERNQKKKEDTVTSPKEIVEQKETNEEIETKKKKEPGFIGKIIRWLRAIPDKIRGIKKKIRGIIKLIKDLKKKAFQIKDFLFHEDNRDSFKGVFGYLIQILKYVKPKKYKCRIEFGTGDPCTTGELLGIISFVHLRYLDKAELVPNFEDAVLKANLYARGRIHLCHFVILAIRGFREKKIMRIYTNLKQLKEEL